MDDDELLPGTNPGFVDTVENIGMVAPVPPVMSIFRVDALYDLLQ